MAVLPIQPTPFFANKNLAFWRLQAVGWGGAMLLRAMSSIANDQPLSVLVLVLIATLTGFSISLILADHLAWSQVFMITALFMLPGVVLTLLGGAMVLVKYF